MSNKKKIIIAIVILFVIWLAWKMYKARVNNMPTDELALPVPGTPGSTGTGTTGTSGGTSTTVNNNTIFSLKSPMMVNERVQWMQYYYNQVAKARKTAGKTPNWPTITEDGRFGSQTNEAMIRMMGKGANSWTEVKTKGDQLLGISTSTASTTPWYAPYYF